MESKISKCESFALSSINILGSEAKESIKCELTQEEQTLLSEILNSIEVNSVEVSKNNLKKLNEKLSYDEVRSIEFDQRIINLLQAVDWFIEYKKSKDINYIADLSCLMLDNVDYLITMFGEGATKSYNLDNMLGDHRMVEELNRQKKILN